MYAFEFIVGGLTPWNRSKTKQRMKLKGESFYLLQTATGEHGNTNSQVIL